jgi:hypothetical protein
MGLGLLALLLGSFMPVHAETAATDFNLQITPSPLVMTVQPGVTSTQDLKIYNNGNGTEKLKIETRAFTYNSDKGRVNLEDTTPASVAPWVSFSQPQFTIQAGQMLDQKVTLSVPKDAGFSYSFALLISRQSIPKAPKGQRAINGSLAVFTLVNVDRPGATSKLQVVQFSSSKHLYEYLPATLNVRFKNTGNTIVQPYGNLFVQRGNSSRTPLATLTVNGTKGYILPGTERTVSADWNDGFATYQSVKQPDGSTKQHLSIDWSKLSHFRFGRYTARLVAVYSDGKHDVPIEGTVTFWVIPWRAILVFIAAVTGLWFLGRWRNKRRTEKAVKRALAAQAAATQQAKAKADEEKT